MDDRTAEDLAAELSLLLHQKLGVKGGGLAEKVSRAGRLLPKRVRRKALEVAEAADRAASPKLARQNDMDALIRAHDEVAHHLDKIDPGYRRRGRLLNFAGTVAFILLMVFGVVVTLLVWGGHL